jgi:flavoprotein
MPLDARKTTHIQAITLKSFTSRQKTVVFVYAASGVYSYVATSVIFRPQDVVDPQVPDLSGGAPKLIFDTLVIAPITVNFVGVVYIADTTTATAGAVAAAHKYEIVQVVPVGIVPSGTHYRAMLRRLR